MQQQDIQKMINFWRLCAEHVVNTLPECAKSSFAAEANKHFSLLQAMAQSAQPVAQQGDKVIPTAS